MNLVKAMQLGLQTLVEKVLSGDIQGPDVWVAFKGATKYATAIASGDIASATVQGERAATCSMCAHATPRTVEVGERKYIAWYCGEPFRETEETCGCLIGVTVNGEEIERAAGKAVVGREQCPLGLW